MHASVLGTIVAFAGIVYVTRVAKKELLLVADANSDNKPSFIDRHETETEQLMDSHETIQMSELTD